MGALGLQAVVLYAPRAPAVATAGLPVDKVVHVLVFALPTAALIAAGVPRAWAITLMSVHAPLSELMQGQVLAQRSAEPADVVADLVGVGLGAWLGHRLVGPQVPSSADPAEPSEAAWMA